MPSYSRCVRWEDIRHTAARTLRGASPVSPGLDSQPLSVPLDADVAAYQRTAGQTTYSGSPEAQTQASASSGGRFALQVRPGSYFVVAQTTSARDPSVETVEASEDQNRFLSPFTSRCRNYRPARPECTHRQWDADLHGEPHCVRVDAGGNDGYWLRREMSSASA